MNYDLAKELKEAGFPQPGLSDEVSGYYIDENNELTGLANDGAVYAPTLEELIEACGKNLDSFNLYKAENCWTAGYGRLADAVMRTGHTPTKAVARLWLALNPIPEAPVEKGEAVTYTPSPCGDPKLEHDCSGCTDRQSEGTHQGCTRQHGHVGCALAVPGKYDFTLDGGLL